MLASRSSKMARDPSDKAGIEGSRPYHTDSGLDAKLDRAVPTIGAEAFLLGVGGLHGGRVYPIQHNTVVIGRSDDADVLVLDPSVSARHAQLINGSRGFEIEDFGSTNGTLVEGRPIGRTLLQGGERITIGQVEFKFLLHRHIDATLTIIPAGIPSTERRAALIRYENPQRSRPPPPPGGRALKASNDDDEEEGLSIEEIIGRLVAAYRFIRRNAFLLGSFLTFGALVGGASVLVLPPAREASCLIKLEPQVKANPVDSQSNRGRPEDQEVRFFDSAETVFVQPALVAGTLEKMLGRSVPDPIVNSIAERLKLEAKPDHMYQATYREKLTGSQTFPPTDFLAAHLDNYLHSEIARSIRVFAAQADFLHEQLTAVESDMNKISDQKMEFSEKNSDRLPDTAMQTMTNRVDLEKRRSELTAQIRELQGDLDGQRHALITEGPLAQTRYHDSEAYRQSLADLNRKLTEAYGHGLADGHPEVRAMKEEKQRLEGLIAKEMGSQTTTVDRASNAGYQELQSRVALLQAQLSAARSNLADTERDLHHVAGLVGDLPRVQAGVQHLTHMQDATTQLHGQLFEQLKKAELQLKLERVSAESRYEVVLPPHLVNSGRAKTGVIRLVMGLALGLFIGLAIIAARKVRQLFRQALSNLDVSPRLGRQ
jgi:pSer/pThr/pTyr-binding forkhead associated (FHA) protein